MKKILAALTLFFCLSSHSEIVSATDTGWETGSLTGWTVGGGSTSTVKAGGWSPNGIGVAVTSGVTNYSPGGGKTWSVTPYGTYMGSLQPGTGSVSFDSAITSLGLTSAENSSIKSYLSAQAAAGGGGNPTPTNATWVKQTVNLTAGTTYTIAWNFLATDYTPFNDGSMMTLTHSTDASKIPTLNNSQQRYALLGFTNPGTGNYATGSYGSTGWQLAVFTVPESGDYTLGFTSFNLGDTALSPILFVDQVQGSTTLNGATFGPVAPNPGSTAPATPVVIAPSPTAIYNQGISNTVYITNHYPTSNNSPAGEGAANAFDNNPDTKYLNFDKKNAGVTVKLNSGRAVTGFTLTTANDFSGRDPTSYKLYGSNDGTNWTLIQEGSLTLSETRKWTSPEIAVSNTNAYVYYYIFFPTTKAGEGCGLNCDSMQIAEISFIYDANSTTTSTSTGSTVSNPGSLCCGASSSSFNADSTKQGRITTFVNRTTADSQVYIEQIGNSNTIVVQQSGTRNNYVDYFGNGSFNNVTITQSGTASTQVNYIEARIGTTTTSSNSNTVNITQTSTGGGKAAFVNISDSNNSLTLQQKDNGSHWADITLTGGNKTVNITQQGSASHMASVGLHGTPTSLTLTQSGSTQQYYSITHTCATAGGCAAITVNQGQ